MAAIFSGFLAGFIYYQCFEKRKINANFDMECWAKLHYMEKEKSSLHQVHLKSMLVGVIIIIFARNGCKNRSRDLLSFFGAAIIGLHTGQFFNEQKYIRG